MSVVTIKGYRLAPEETLFLASSLNLNRPASTIPRCIVPITLPEDPQAEYCYNEYWQAKLAKLLQLD